MSLSKEDKKANVSWATLILLYSTIFLQTAAQKSPWDTPLDELKTVQKNISVCSNKSFDPNIEPLELQWQNCIIPFLPNVEVDENSSETDEEQERQFYSHFCHNRSAYKKCWLGIVEKLNECTPGRGRTSGLIYFSMYDYSCTNNGTDIIENRMKASETEDLCDHNYATQVCKDSFQEWNSADLCRRFVAQRDCDISSLSLCTNIKHKEFSEDNLNQIQQSLGCHKTEDALVIASSSNHLFAGAIFIYTTILMQTLLQQLSK